MCKRDVPASLCSAEVKNDLTATYSCLLTLILELGFKAGGTSAQQRPTASPFRVSKWLLWVLPSMADENAAAAATDAPKCVRNAAHLLPSSSHKQGHQDLGSAPLLLLDGSFHPYAGAGPSASSPTAAWTWSSCWTWAQRNSSSCCQPAPGGGLAAA